MPLVEKYQGFGLVDPSDWKHPKKIVFDPKPFGPHDVEVKIEACGVCGSDVHCASGHWGSIPQNLVVGHEIIGRVVALGPEAHTGLKIGDRVGIGAQVYSCLDCDRCKSSNEPYCPKFVTTYNQAYEDGYISQGGYASHIRAHEHFVIPIPDSIPSELAAPLLCGGITVFSPLIRNGCGPGKKVGIVGIGGIGHMGVILAGALGAEVYAISRSSAKKEDAFKLGAKHFIATKEELDWDKKYYDTFDLIVVCSSSLTEIDFNVMPHVMKVGGRIVSIAAPALDEKLILKPQGMMGISIANTLLGSVQEVKTMLDLVAEKDLKIWVETIKIGEAGINEAFERMERGDVKYRFTLVGYEEEFQDV